MGNLFGPIGKGSGGGGAVGTGIVTATLPAGITANYAGILSSTGVALLAADASGSTLDGMDAGFNGQWVMIINSGAVGNLSLPSGLGSPVGNSFLATLGYTLTLSPGGRTIAVYLTALNGWSIG